MELINICLHHSNQCLYLSILPCQTKVTLCKVMYISVPFCTFLYLLEPFGNFEKNIKSILLASLTKILPTHIDPKSVCIIFLAHTYHFPVVVLKRLSFFSSSFSSFSSFLSHIQLSLRGGGERGRAFFSDSLERLLRAVRERSSQQ